MRPHLPLDTNKRIFWKRTNKGNEQMTYEEIRMSFLNYEERREKLKLLYVELLSNKENLEAMKIDATEINNFYSLITIESTIIDSMLTDLYTIIDKDQELIKLLFTIRREIRTINNEKKFSLQKWLFL
jgi:hypothetical protein